MEIVDHIFIQHKKIKPIYSFQKYEYVSFLDSGILDIRTIMKGYNSKNISSFFIVETKNKKNIWKHYESLNDPVGNYIPIEMLYNTHGSIISKINGKDIRKY